MQAPQSTTPSSTGQDLAVFGFCELWALVFALPPGEDLYHGTPMSARMVAFLCIGAAFAILGPTWPWIRRKVKFFWLIRIATDFGYWLFALGFLSIWLQISSIRSDFETYVMPRVVTEGQADEIRSYLATREPQNITIKFDLRFDESSQYGSQLFEAITRGGWTANIDASDNEPRAQGFGLRINETGINSKLKDPKRDPGAIISQALQSAHISINGGSGSGAGEYKLYLMVGPRPLALSREPSILNRLGHWLIRLGGGM
jgi:hypothetical protein